MPGEAFKILTRNFLDSNSVITTTFGGETQKLFDQDRESIFESAGGNRDNMEAIIDITFKDATGDDLTVNLNSLVILNTNMKQFYYEKFNATTGTWENLLFWTENASENMCFTHGNKTANRVRLRLKRTMQPNDPKYIGELYIGRLRWNLPQPSVFSTMFKEKSAVIELANGSLHRAINRFSPTRTARWRANLAWDYLTREQYDCLRQLKDEGVQFTVMPEPDFNPQDLFEVRWVSDFRSRYTAEPYKGAGYSVSAEFEEV